MAAVLNFGSLKMAPCGRMSPSFFSFLLFMMATVAVLVQPSAATQATCNRYIRSQCGHYRNYFNAYDSQVDQKYKVLDGIDAQVNYINLADENRVSNNIIKLIITSYRPPIKCQTYSSWIFFN